MKTEVYNVLQKSYRQFEKKVESRHRPYYAMMLGLAMLHEKSIKRILEGTIS